MHWSMIDKKYVYIEYLVYTDPVPNILMEVSFYMIFQCYTMRLIPFQPGNLKFYWLRNWFWHHLQ